MIQLKISNRYIRETIQVQIRTKVQPRFTTPHSGSVPVKLWIVCKCCPIYQKLSFSESARRVLCFFLPVNQRNYVDVPRNNKKHGEDRLLASFIYGLLNWWWRFSLQTTRVCMQMQQSTHKGNLSSPRQRTFPRTFPPNLARPRRGGGRESPDRDNGWSRSGKYTLDLWPPVASLHGEQCIV